MSKAKAKGTAGENEVVDLMVDVGFPRADPEDPNSVGVKRFEGGYESHDIQGVGEWTIEVKYRRAWHLFGWIRKIRKRAIYRGRTVHTEAMRKAGLEPMVIEPQPSREWAIFAIHGDRRTVEGREVGEVCIMDARTAAELIHHWETTA